MNPVSPPANSRAHALPDVRAEEGNEHNKGVRQGEVGQLALLVGVGRTTVEADGFAKV